MAPDRKNSQRGGVGNPEKGVFGDAELNALSDGVGGGMRNDTERRRRTQGRLACEALGEGVALST